MIKSNFVKPIVVRTNFWFDRCSFNSSLWVWVCLSASVSMTAVAVVWVSGMHMSTSVLECVCVWFWIGTSFRLRTPQSHTHTRRWYFTISATPTIQSIHSHTSKASSYLKICSIVDESMQRCTNIISKSFVLCISPLVWLKLAGETYQCDVNHQSHKIPTIDGASLRCISSPRFSRTTSASCSGYTNAIFCELSVLFNGSLWEN